jgi:glycosyltransferase involved in cell wall biosynthesis
MNELTVIIPFLNEGEEVESTMQSIRRTVGERVDIVLVNDCSTDGVDYGAAARKYNADYIVNTRRQGVARSRDLGVAHARTPYVLLLDGHMRFYDDRWDERLVDCLKEDERAVYCFRCGTLGEDHRETITAIRNGAYLRFYAADATDLLTPAWRADDKFAGEDSIEDIPCVLGACYGVSVKYWDRVGGLGLLRYYGADEACLSLKVWLEGGRCRLIGDVTVGHLFRTPKQRPYDATMIDGIYNRLVIADTTLPLHYRRYLHAELKSDMPDNYNAARALQNSRRDEIEAARQRLEGIFTRDFAFFEELNERHSTPVSAPPRPDLIDLAGSGRQEDLEAAIRMKTDEIAEYLLANPTRSATLATGGLGEMIFLWRWACSRGGDPAALFGGDPEERLREMLAGADLFARPDAARGAAGVALGLMRLAGEGFPGLDRAKIYPRDAADRLAICMLSEARQPNLGLLTGAAGIGLALHRLDRERYAPHLRDLTARLEAWSAGIPDDASMSMADGVAGLLIFAAEAALESEAIPRMADHIAGRRSAAAPLSAVDGDLAAGWALIKAAKHGNCDWRETGLELARGTLARRDPVMERVDGAGLMYGTAGLAASYRALADETGEEPFAEAARHWSRQTLYRAINGVVPAGYKARGTTNPDISRSLLHGVAGVGLGLLVQL